MYLGIDLGTSSLKIIVIDENTQLIASSSAPLQVITEKPLHSEQNPEDWWQALVVAMAELSNRVDLKQLKAIGLSGQQHGAVLLDKQGRVLRHAILWNDGRSFAECSELEKRVPHLSQIIGSRIMPGFTAPKLMWVQKHEPEIFDQVHKVLLPKDYLRYRLSGLFASDMSDASGTGWLDISSRSWSKQMLDATEMSIDKMPLVYEGNEVTGVVSPHIAELFSIPKTTTIVAGAGDNAASAISMNVIRPGQALLSIGTSGVYFVPTDHYIDISQNGIHTFAHAIPKVWHHMSVHLNSASALTWWSEICQQSINDLSAQAELSSHQSSIIFLPYLSGERTPVNNPHARGTFIGMGTNTTTADMTNAVMKGVALAFLSGQEAITAEGIDIHEVLVVGGGAQNHYWGKMIASALNKTLSFPKNRELGSALGAAMLAWMGYNKANQLTSPEIAFTIEPDKNLHAKLSNDYNNFKEVYTQLQNTFQKLI